MKLKVCGMKFSENMLEVANLEPDYMGFIFYKASARYFDAEIPKLSKNIAKIGVFVNASVEEILAQVEKHQLDGVQLHGQESAVFCNELRSACFRLDAQLNAEHKLILIKVFSANSDFDFGVLAEYEAVCDYFLFDTKGKLPGGNGETFDWTIFNAYPSKKPFFLSGGIGLDTVEELNQFIESPASNYCHAIDVNSKFEDQPGLKNLTKLKAFREHF